MIRSLHSHLTLAHHLWEEILEPHDLAIDATCGNGHDTLKLATLLFQGSVIAIDIQSQAIKNTRSLLKEHRENVFFYQQSHASFPESILPESVSLIVYNLGYLPKSDKTIKTKEATTLMSLRAALPLLKKRGVISMICYPGHPEGKEERDAVLNFLIGLDSKIWKISRHLWPQGVDKPELFIIQKNS